MKRNCELCPARAALYCAADEAYICWKCDANVHSANFLVARHYRTVLCRRCSSRTLWRASGARLHPTACLCPPCKLGNIAADDSGKSSNEYALNSSNLSSRISTSECSDRPDYNATLCSSLCDTTDKVAFCESNRTAESESKVRCARHNRPRSPVSVITSGRPLLRKTRALVLKQAFCPTSSDSDSEDYKESTANSKEMEE